MVSMKMLGDLGLEEPEFQSGLCYLLAVPILDEPHKHIEPQFSYLSNGNNQGIVSASKGYMED